MNINAINRRLKILKKNWPNKKSILFRHRFTIDENQMHIFKKYIDKDDFLYMRFPDKEKTLIGYGQAIKHISKNSFSQFSDRKYNIKSNVKSDHVDILGGAGFNIKKSEEYPWEGIPAVQFTIPRFLFSFIKNKTHLTYSCLITKHSKINELLHEFEELQNSLSYKTNYKKTKIKLSKKHLIPNKKEHLKTIDVIKEKITEKVFKKAVLSRIEQYNISHNIDYYHIMDGLNKQYPNCFNFLIKFNKNNCFFGSSPEKIIEKNKHSYTTTAIAGTSKRNSLLKNKKEIEEHNYVVEHLKNTLKKYSKKFIVSKTQILKLSYTNHIQTNIKGNTLHEMHILDLLNIIYPTPALSGFPIKKSLKIINELEPFSRGWYAGAIGMYNLNGNGSFHAPIRSALIKNNKIFLYSGGGIVNDSIGENEWEETNIKLHHLKSIF